MTLHVLCSVAVVWGRLKWQRRVHVARAGPSLLQTLHLQEDTRRVSRDRLWIVLSDKDQAAAPPAVFKGPI